ncbi:MULTISPECIES: DUF5794 domain-containing protein [Halobacterium]|uniref:Uncharacterized protein n=1 Tax=Halobacterium salinarum (strain ATCC 33171 / DSM 3754 / JCM 8978 / NBRC 102687 / NCIMB 764 / 91-R6) TaxID=2597657 RepID=A0A4D6GSU8_HALS9|nr:MULTISPECIES: DUF5794 domain-containing protein [Halobacterium]MCF2165558.1 hypothetical protein [Halobacterium salinarum]MCF2168733.1 hypothetical protein [Halobacterium salinarum]MCF2207344.1 hypothetical protein [Halobacterium salinarum]MCF2238598.1 hypothetical protein [Halobacterium salinarum]MCF2240811.1 hypothetical protein [Halobacterium salinarum]
MSSSRHPVALRLEQQVGGATKLLATVTLLPLVDGIFAALVLAGALDTWAGVLQTGLLVFGGSATLAVILAEMDGTRREQATSVLIVGVPLIVIATAEAALAPTVDTVVDIHTFERFAALVILAIAAKTASATIGEYLPSPSVIIGLGFLASASPANARLVTQYENGLLLHAAAAGGVAVTFALVVVALGPALRRVVDIDRFRFGSAVALATLALSVFNLVPSQAPLMVFAVAGLLAFDPDQAASDDAEAAPDGEGGPDGITVPADDGPDARATPPATDGGNGHEPDEAAYGYPGEDTAEERAPWL